MSKTFGSIALALLLAATVMAGPASAATITVSASVGGAATGTILDNLNWLTAGSSSGGTGSSGISVAFTSDGKAVTGSLSGDTPRRTFPAAMELASATATAWTRRLT